MKKVALILILCLLLGGLNAHVNVVFSASDATYEDNHIFNLMNAIGEFGYTGEDGAHEITRGEFAYLLSKLLWGDDNTPDERKATEAYFYDVPAEHKYYFHINRICTLGYMQGYGASIFGADDKITVKQAAKTLVVVLGYQGIIDADGNEQGAYMRYAANAGLLPSGGATDDNMCLADAFRMIYNAFTADTVDVRFSSNGASYYKSGKTILEETLRVGYTEGLVTSNEVTSMTGYPVASEGEFAVSDVRIKADYSSIYEYMGEHVRCYWRLDDDEKKHCLYIYQDKGGSLTVNIRNDYTSQDDFNNCSFLYTDDKGKKKKVKFSGTPDVFINGINTNESFGFEHLGFNTGTVVFVDNNGDNIYDVIKIFRYDFIYAAADVYADTSIVADFYDPSKTIEFENNEAEVYCNIFKDGRAVDKTAITYKSIVSYSRSKIVKGKQAITIHVSDLTTTGELKYLKTGREISEMVVNDQKYEISPDIAGDFPELGTYGVFYFDFERRLVMYEKLGKDDMFYGFVTEVRTGKLDPFRKGDVLGVELFGEGGKVVLYECDEKFRLNGERCASYTAMLNVLGQSVMYEGCISQIVRYRLNEENKITEMYTASSENENAPKVGTLKERRFTRRTIHGMGNLKYDFRFDQNTVFFVVGPYDPASKTFNEKYFYTCDYWDPSQSAMITSMPVDVDDDGIAGLVLLTSTPASVGNYTYPSIVKDIVRELDNDGEIRTKFVVYRKGVEYEYFLKNEDDIDVDNYRRGDLIRFVEDLNGEIAVSPAMFMKVDEMTQGVAGSWLDTYIKTIYGKPVRIKGSILSMRFDEAEPTNADQGDVDFCSIGDGKFRIFNTSSGELTTKPISELMNYKDNNILAIINDGATVELIIFK